jgi:hypothetical protein
MPWASRGLSLFAGRSLSVEHVPGRAGTQNTAIGNEER